MPGSSVPDQSTWTSEAHKLGTPAGGCATIRGAQPPDGRAGAAVARVAVGQPLEPRARPRWIASAPVRVLWRAVVGRPNRQNAGPGAHRPTRRPVQEKCPCHKTSCTLASSPKRGRPLVFFAYLAASSPIIFVAIYPLTTPPTPGSTATFCVLIAFAVGAMLALVRRGMGGEMAWALILFYVVLMVASILNAVIRSD